MKIIALTQKQGSEIKKSKWIKLMSENSISNNDLILPIFVRKEKIKLKI